VNFPRKVGSWKLGSIDSLLKRIHTTGTIALQPGSGRPCAQLGGQAKRHRSARDISHETGIPHSGVHWIIRSAEELICFKRRRAQLLSEANRVANLSP